MTVGPSWYMTLAAVLFVVGLLGMMVRKNFLVQLMCLQLMLNAVGLTFVAAGRARGYANGEIAALFLVVTAAAEATVGLAIAVSVFRKRNGASPDELSGLKG